MVKYKARNLMNDRYIFTVLEAVDNGSLGAVYEFDTLTKKSKPLSAVVVSDEAELGTQEATEARYLILGMAKRGDRADIKDMFPGDALNSGLIETDFLEGVKKGYVLVVYEPEPKGRVSGKIFNPAYKFIDINDVEELELEGGVIAERVAEDAIKRYFENETKSEAPGPRPEQTVVQKAKERIWPCTSWADVNPDMWGVARPEVPVEHDGSVTTVDYPIKDAEETDVPGTEEVRREIERGEVSGTEDTPAGMKRNPAVKPVTKDDDPENMKDAFSSLYDSREKPDTDAPSRVVRFGSADTRSRRERANRFFNPDGTVRGQ
jgi:hypothetical protein